MTLIAAGRTILSCVANTVERMAEFLDARFDEVSMDKHQSQRVIVIDQLDDHFEPRVGDQSERVYENVRNPHLGQLPLGAWWHFGSARGASLKPWS